MFAESKPKKKTRSEKQMFDFVCLFKSFSVQWGNLAEQSKSISRENKHQVPT